MIYNWKRILSRIFEFGANSVTNIAFWNACNVTTIVTINKIPRKGIKDNYGRVTSSAHKWNL